MSNYIKVSDNRIITKIDLLSIYKVEKDRYCQINYGIYFNYKEGKDDVQIYYYNENDRDNWFEYIEKELILYD